MATAKKFGIYASDEDMTVHVEVNLYDRARSAQELRKFRSKLKGQLHDALRNVGFGFEQIDIKNLNPRS